MIAVFLGFLSDSIVKKQYRYGKLKYESKNVSFKVTTLYIRGQSQFAKSSIGIGWGNFI